MSKHSASRTAGGLVLGAIFGTSSGDYTLHIDVIFDRQSQPLIVLGGRPVGDECGTCGTALRRRARA
jgi:hypothetical protein